MFDIIKSFLSIHCFITCEIELEFQKALKCYYIEDVVIYDHNPRFLTTIARLGGSDSLFFGGQQRGFVIVKHCHKLTVQEVAEFFVSTKHSFECKGSHSENLSKSLY